MICNHAGCLAGIHGVTFWMAKALIKRGAMRPGWRYPGDDKTPAVERTLCPAHAPKEASP